MTGDDHTATAVRRLLSEDAAIADQGIEVTRRDQVLLLAGEVESPHRRHEIERLVRIHFPELTVHNEIGVTRSHPPESEPEELT